MKKFLAPFAVLFFVAPQSMATTLWVKNKTNETIKVSVRGSYNSNRSTAKTIAAGKWASFFAWRSISGPLIFAFEKDMEKDGFIVYTYPSTDKKKAETHLFPITPFATKEIQIIGGKIKSDGKRKKPELSWKFRRSRDDSPWKKLKEKHGYLW